MEKGHAHLVAVMDWHTRAVLFWKLSNTLDASYCLTALREAVAVAGRAPGIFNTDQGDHFTTKIYSVARLCDSSPPSLKRLSLGTIWLSLFHK